MAYILPRILIFWGGGAAAILVAQAVISGQVSLLAVGLLLLALALVPVWTAAAAAVLSKLGLHGRADAVAELPFWQAREP